MATLGKEQPIGKFAEGWRNALKQDESLTQVELAPALAHVLATRDANEQARSHGCRFHRGPK